MRILLDECVPRPLRRDLPGHDVRTVVEMGWDGIQNGTLLRIAATEFDCFLTADRSLEFQQNLAVLPIPVIIMATRGTDLDALRPLMPQVRELLTRIEPGRLYRVQA